MTARNFLKLFRLSELSFVAALLLSFTEGAQVCEQRITDCEGESCFKSILCYHGDCNDVGKCECDFCWEGESCQEYVDNFLPEFITAEETVIFGNVWGQDIIYTARAYDSDLGTTCSEDATLCECAEIRYKVDGSFFHINNPSGDIYVKEATQLEPGNVYNLTVTAMTQRGEMSPSPSAHLKLNVVINDPGVQVLSQNILSLQGNDNSEDGVLLRKKRNAEENSFSTEFDLTLTSGEPEDMKVGRRVDYKLDITVPKTEAMDLIIEVFTKDVGNSDYTPVLAVFNVKMDSKDDGVTFSEGDEPSLEMLLNEDINTAYDRAILTFGDVTNTDDEAGHIYVQFSVTQIKNPETSFDSPYLVMAGAEFDQETYVWIELSEITVHDSEEENSIVVEVTGDDEIPLDSAGVYLIKTYCAVRSDNFTYEVIGPEEKDVVSVGNLGVKDFDVNYDPVPQSIYYYNTTKEGSDDTAIYTKATMNLGIMTNVGNYKAPEEKGNLIEVTFAIYALNFEENVGKELEFTTTVTVGEAVLHSKPFKVKLVARKDADKTITIRAQGGDLIPNEAGIGDMAMYTLWFNLTEGGYADFVVEASVDEFKGIPRLEACSARLWQYMGSFDVPYLNTTFIDPEIDGEKFLFKFNRIHVTDQRTPSIYNDTMIYVQLIMKVSAVSVNKADEKLDPELKVGSQGSPDDAISVPTLIIAEKMTDYKSPAMEIESGVRWEELYLGGAIVLNITMWVPEGRGYPEVFVEASGETNPSLPAIHICKAELSDVGKNLPCLRIHQDEVNEKQTKYSKTDPPNRFLPDMTSLMLGDVGALPVEGENYARVSIVVSLPENSTISGIDLYPISSGILMSRNTIWTAMANVTVKEGSPPDLQEDQQPEASVSVGENVKVVPGHFTEVEVLVNTKIQSISTVTVELEGASNDVSLCSFRVKSYGKNLPCVDMDTKPFYELHENPLDGNKIGGIKFMALSNIGFQSNEEDDQLKLIALVHISPTCTESEVELLWRVKFGGGQKDGSVKIEVDPNADSSDPSDGEATKPKSLTFKPAYDGKAISLGSPVVVDFEMSLEAGSLAKVNVEIKNLDAEKKFPYDMCIGGMWFRGKNYPCFSPMQLTGTFSSSSDSSGHNDTAVYDLGLLCNTFVDEEEEENKVIIRVAMRPVDDGSVNVGDSFSIEGHATVGAESQKIDTLEFKIEENPDEVEAEVKPTMKLIQADAYPMKIRQRLWIPFSITIPVDSVLKVTVEAKAPIEDDRAVLTVHNLRLKSGGINIPCPMLYPDPTVTLDSTTETTQKDVAKAEIGYFTNLGLTHKMNIAEEGDDDLTIEVEVEMSDHPLTDHKEQFMLKLVAEVGETTLELDQPVEVERDGNEKADLDVTIMVDNSKTHQSGDQIDVTMTILHKNESTAEPESVIIRFYLPPYVEYGSDAFNNATVVGDVQFIAEYGGLDVKIPQFLFTDSVTITMSLLADPKNKRGFGKGEIEATTPYRVLCMQTFREQPTNNPSAKDKIINCGPIGHLMYSINSEECYNALGLDKIDKCQLTASSAAKKDLGPQNIGKGVNKGWSPALRLGPQKPYLQVDFQRTARVSRLEFVKVDGTRSITKYRLQYSHTGSAWTYANEATELTYNDGAALDDLETPVQSRFVKIVVEDAEKDDEDSKYIGLEMEMYGCYISEKSASAMCPQKDPTWYSDDKNQYGRHFSVDTDKNIIYFCDLEYDMGNLVCFSSADAGSSWRILPRSIGGLIGYDTDSGLTYAFDRRRRAYVASDDGTNWIPKEETEVNSTADKDTFSKSQQVPAYTTGDIESLVKKTGMWEASFDGLIYDGNADPRARWSRCCKME